MYEESDQDEEDSEVPGSRVTKGSNVKKTDPKANAKAADKYQHNNQYHNGKSKPNENYKQYNKSNTKGRQSVDEEDYDYSEEDEEAYHNSYGKKNQASHQRGKY